MYGGKAIKNEKKNRWSKLSQHTKRGNRLHVKTPPHLSAFPCVTLCTRCFGEMGILKLFFVMWFLIKLFDCLVFETFIKWLINWYLDVYIISVSQPRNAIKIMLTYAAALVLITDSSVRAPIAFRVSWTSTDTLIAKADITSAVRTLVHAVHRVIAICRIVTRAGYMMVMTLDACVFITAFSSTIMT